MFDVQETQPELIRRWLDGDRVAGREAARLHIDYTLLRKLGMDPVKKPLNDDRDPIERLEARVHLQEQLIRGLLAIAAGDPDPRPNLAPLFDPAIHAEATRALLDRMTAAVDVLKREAKKLETFEAPGDGTVVRRVG